MPVFTFTEVVAKAQASVAANPDRTNNGQCYYLLDGEPNCIAAQVMSDLGVPNAALDDMEGSNLRSHAVEHALREYDFALDDDAIDFLDTLQGHADNRFVGHMGSAWEGPRHEDGTVYGHVVLPGSTPWRKALTDTLSLLPAEKLAALPKGGHA